MPSARTRYSAWDDMGDKLSGRFLVRLSGDRVADASTVADALARSEADLFVEDDRVLWLTAADGLVVVTENVLKEIISKFVAIKKLGGIAEKPEVEYVPVNLDEQMVRTILLGQDPYTGVPLKGGSLASRLPKA